MSTKKAYVKQIKGITFAGKTDSKHWITMDGPEDFGGSDSGIWPKELVLLALAGCTGSDVVSILQKKRVNLTDFEINISAELSDEHPKVYTDIDLEYVFLWKRYQRERCWKSNRAFTDILLRSYKDAGEINKN